MLRINPDPIKIVPAAQRDVWLPKREHRCYYEDGRGRCRSFETRAVSTALGVEFYCDNHYTGEPRGRILKP